MAKKSSGKAQREYWYNAYKKVLEQHDVKIKPVKRVTKASVESLKKKYNKLAKEENLGGIRQEYNRIIQDEQTQADWRIQERVEDNRTPSTPVVDFNVQTVEDFIAMVESVYQDTLNYADTRKESDTLAGVLYYGYDRDKGMSNIDSLSRSKTELLEFIHTMYEESNNQVEYVAEAIRRSKDLDYSIGVTLVPPSDVVFDFDFTLENLKAIWTTIVQEAKDAQEGSTYY